MLPETSRKHTRLSSAIFLLLSLALPLAAKFYLNAEIGVFPLLLIIFAVAGPVYLYRYRVKDYPWSRYLSAAAVSILGFCILVGILITPLSAYIYWFESFAAGIPEGEVGTIFVLLVTLFSIVVAPLSRKIGLLWPFFILAIVVFYLLTIIVQKDYYVLVLSLLMTAAAVYFMVRRVKSGGRLTNSVFATGLIFLTLFVAILFPDLAKAKGNEFVNNTIFPSLRKAVVKVFPRFPLLYAVPGYGMSFDESELGGRPHLVDNPLFEVEGPPGELLYLRTRVFDTYNGTSWSMSPASSNRQSARAAAAGFFRVTEEPSGDYITLSVTAKSFFYLPYTLDTKRVHCEKALPSLESGTRDTGFELAGPLRTGTQIHLEKYTPGESISQNLVPEVRARYMQIPEDLPPELVTIAEQISRGTSSKAEILARIEAFLAYNYTYSVDVDDLYLRMQEPERRDFAYAFLFQESTGYCVHFATSFILLARLAGVPARYATGFYSRIPQDQTSTIVTGLSAHAWPEVWLEGSGWSNWEATPAANAANYTITGEDWFFNLGIDLDPATARQLEGLMGRNIAGSGAAEDTDSGKSVPVGLLFIVFGSVAGAALLTVWAVRSGYPAVRYVANRKGRMFYSLKHLARRLEHKGVPSPEKTGWLAWSEEVKSLVAAAPGPAAPDDAAPDGRSDTGARGKDDNDECRQIDAMIGDLLAQTYGNEEWRPEVAANFAVFKKHVLEGLKRRSRR